MKLKKYKAGFYYLVLIWVAVSSGLMAQKTMPINLEKVLELGGANNLSIQQYRQQSAIAQAEYVQHKEWWLPVLYFGARTHQLSGAAMNGNGRFFIDIDRNNLWTGLGLGANWDFGAGIFPTKAAKLRGQAATYQSQTERNTTLLKIIDVYYDFMVAQAKYMAFQQLVQEADTIATQLAVMVDAGLRYQSESLLSKSNAHLLQVSLLESKGEWLQAELALINLLQLDSDVHLVSVDTILTPIDFWTTNPADNINQSIESRPDWQGHLLRLEALKFERKTATTGLLLPSLQLDTYRAAFGSANGQAEAIQPELFPTTQQLYGTQALNLSLMWNVPLGHLFYRGDVKRSDANLKLQQLKLDQLKGDAREEIARAISEYNISKEQLELAEQASQFAHEAFTQGIQRQALGTAMPLELLQAQEIFVKTRMHYLEAAAKYNKSQYQLFVARGGLL